MADHLVAVVDGDVGEVFELVHMRLAGCGDVFGDVGGEMVEDGKVVGGEVPDDVDIVLEEAEVDAGGVVIVELAEGAFVDHFADAADGAGEEEGVVHHDLQVFALGEFDELLGLSGG